jgi:hypothetical protein
MAPSATRKKVAINKTKKTVKSSSKSVPRPKPTVSSAQAPSTTLPSRPASSRAPTVEVVEDEDDIPHGRTLSVDSDIVMGEGDSTDEGEENDESELSTLKPKLMAC